MYVAQKNSQIKEVSIIGINGGIVEKPNIIKQPQTLNSAIHWSMYRDKYLGIEVKYPSNWFIDKEYYQQGIINFRSTRDFQSLEGVIYIATKGDSVALSPKNQNIKSFMLNDLKIFEYRQPLLAADRIFPTINFKFINETDQRKIWMWGIIPSKNQNEFEDIIYDMLRSFRFINQ